MGWAQYAVANWAWGQGVWAWVGATLGWAQWAPASCEGSSHGSCACRRRRAD